MRKTKGTGKTKTKTKSLVKRRRRQRNPSGDRPLSFNSSAQDDMPNQTDASSNLRVHDSINRVLAECDKVAAALIEMRHHDLPPLTVKEVDVAEGGRAVKRVWAVVSADPHRPLTEWQAKDIVAALRSTGTNARN